VKVATWNIERLKHNARLDQIQSCIRKVDSDVLVLTESDLRVKLEEFEYSVSTDPLPEPIGFYRKSERRVTIHSKYPITENVETFDSQTARCVLVRSPFGLIAFYGMITGVRGNRLPSFKEDLQQQVRDFNRISSQYPLCIMGDYNISFSDIYYYTKEGRSLFNQVFHQNGLVNLTEGLQDAVDHIALSRDILKNKVVGLTEWNLDKTLSDHKGVSAEITEL
jgi:exonuclease III